MILSAKEGKTIVDKILAAAKADAVRISIGGGDTANLRFARNTVTTSGKSQDTRASITATFGKKSGSFSFNQFDDTSILDAVRKTEDLAKLAPEDPEYMPPLGQQQYSAVKAFVESTANLTPQFRADIAGECIKLAEEK